METKSTKRPNRSIIRRRIRNKRKLQKRNHVRQKQRTQSRNRRNDTTIAKQPTSRFLPPYFLIFQQPPLNSPKAENQNETQHRRNTPLPRMRLRKSHNHMEKQRRKNHRHKMPQIRRATQEKFSHTDKPTEFSITKPAISTQPIKKVASAKSQQYSYQYSQAKVL
jgi:hypothetical protein